MTELQDAVTRLVSVMDFENEALRRLDLSGAASLLPQKHQALEVLEKLLLRIGPLSQADKVVHALMVRLRDTTGENKRLLERGMTAQRHVMSLLAHAARGANQAMRYGSRGTYVARAEAVAFAVSARA